MLPGALQIQILCIESLSQMASNSGLIFGFRVQVSLHNVARRQVKRTAFSAKATGFQGSCTSKVGSCGHNSRRVFHDLCSSPVCCQPEPTRRVERVHRNIVEADRAVQAVCHGTLDFLLRRLLPQTCISQELLQASDLEFLPAMQQPERETSTVQ